MAKAKSPIPEGQHAVTAHLTLKGGAKAIEFYKKAFGATELSRMEGPGGLIMHAALRIGDSMFFLNDEMPGRGSDHAPTPSPTTLGGTPVTINLYVADCDKVFNQAVAAGAKVGMPLADQFWGDRYGHVTDPFGHRWAIATRKEDLSPAELEERGRQFFSSMQNQR